MAGCTDVPLLTESSVTPVCCEITIYGVSATACPMVREDRLYHSQTQPIQFFLYFDCTRTFSNRKHPRLPNELKGGQNEKSHLF